MPPLPRELQAKDAGEVFAELPRGEYRMTVTPIMEAFPVAEGGMYFSTGGKVFMVWPDDGRKTIDEKR